MTDTTTSLAVLTHRVAIAVLMALMLFSTATTCDEDSTSASTTTTLAFSATDFLAAASESVANMSTAKFTMVDEKESGESFYGMTFKDMEASVQDPNSLDILIRVLNPSLGFVEVRMIKVGDQAAMKLSKDAPWRSIPPDNVPFNFNGLKTMFDLLPTTIQDLAIVGREEAQNNQTTSISGVITSDDLTPLIMSADAGHEVTITLWINETDLELKQLQFAGKIFDGDDPETVRFLVVTDVNVPLTIELPEITP